MNDVVFHAKQRLRNRLLPLAARTLNRPAAGDLNTILIFQPDHLGDIILSQPAVQLIRQRYPDARLIGVVGPWSQEIASLAWPVDDLICIEFPGFAREQTSELLDPYRLLSIESKRLRKLRAGQAFVLRPDAWWSAWLAAQSVSGTVVTSNDPRLSPFASETVDLNDQVHATERALAIAACRDSTWLMKFTNTGLNLPPSETGISNAAVLLSHIYEKLYIVLHPGSGARVKQWPVNRWRKLVSDLTDIQIVVTGSTNEKPVCDQISDGFNNVTNIAGQTDILALIEVLRQAELAVGADSGPMHIAVATDTESIHLFGPSDPRIYGPWGDSLRHRVITAGWNCPRCGDLSVNRKEGCGCMLAITTSDVKAAVHEQLVQAF